MNRYPGDFQRFAKAVQKQMFNAGAGGRGPKYPQTPRGVFAGVGGLVFLGAGAMLLNASLYNVDGGHRAVLYSRISGVQPQVLNEGTHFVIPWVQIPLIYNVRSKPRNVSSLTGTNDLQMVNITCRLLSRPDVSHLPTIYRTLGQDYDERVLPSIVNEVLKAVIAQFNASQLITQRDHVSRLIRDNLVRRASKFHILLDDVSITYMTFSPEFTHAVEAKQIAQQDAQRATFLVDKALQEKQGMIVKAQGEAKSAELIGEAIKKTKDYVELKRLGTAREIATILSESQNRVILDNEALLLNTVTDNRDRK